MMKKIVLLATMVFAFALVLPAGGVALAADASVASGVQSVVDVNSATVEELIALPGIGPVTARRIVEYRDQHGSFSSADQLLEVKGIGEATLGKIRGMVRIM